MRRFALLITLLASVLIPLNAAPGSAGAATAHAPRVCRPELKSLQLSETNVMAGTPITATVTLTCATTHRVRVFTDNSGAVQFHPNVWVKAGQRQATITVETSPVSTRTAHGTISAHLGSRTRVARITVRPLPTPPVPATTPCTPTATIDSSPYVVYAGDTETMTVTLVCGNYAVSALRPTVIALASSDPHLAIPSTVTVPSGAYSAPVTVSAPAATTDAASNYSATLSATLNGTSRTVPLLVEPGLKDISSSQTTTSTNFSIPFDLVARGSTSVEVDASSDNPALLAHGTYMPAHTSRGSVFVTVERTVTVDTPITITVRTGSISFSTTVTLLRAFDPAIDTFNVTASSNSTAAAPNVGAFSGRILLATTHPLLGASPAMSVTVDDDPEGLVTVGSYWTGTAGGEVDFAVAAASAAEHARFEITIAGVVSLCVLDVEPGVASLTLPVWAHPGDSVTGVVTLAGAADVDSVVTVSSPFAAIPATTVTIPAGQTLAPFALTLPDACDVNAAVPCQVSIGARIGTTFAVARMGLTTSGGPEPLLEQAPPDGSTSPGGEATATVHLIHALSVDTVITLSTRDPEISLPASVTVPAGQTTAHFPVLVSGSYLGSYAIIQEQAPNGSGAQTGVWVTSPAV